MYWGRRWFLVGSNWSWSKLEHSSVNWSNWTAWSWISGPFFGSLKWALLAFSRGWLVRSFLTAKCRPDVVCFDVGRARPLLITGRSWNQRRLASRASPLSTAPPARLLLHGHGHYDRFASAAALHSPIHRCFTRRSKALARDSWRPQHQWELCIEHFYSFFIHWWLRWLRIFNPISLSLLLAGLCH